MSHARHGPAAGHGTQGLTLTPGTAPGNTNPPNTTSGSASIFLRGGRALDQDGIVSSATCRSTPGQPYIVEVWVDASGTNADSAKPTVTLRPDAAAT